MIFEKEAQMVSNTSRSDDLRVVSGMPGRRRLVVDDGGREHIAPDMKAGANCLVGTCDLQ